MDGETGRGAELRERAFNFACAVVSVHRVLYRSEPALRSVSGQAVRAAGSIGANLEEADAAQSRPDFISKCTISLKEARESRYWLRVLQKSIPGPPAAINTLIPGSTELIAILTTIVRKTRQGSNSSRKGTQP